MPIDKCLASLLIYSYSFDSKIFSLGNGFPTKCCVDRLKPRPKVEILRGVLCYRAAPRVRRPEREKDPFIETNYGIRKSNA